MLELFTTSEHASSNWVLVSFALFVVIAFKLGRKSIIGKLDGRIEEVKLEIETAERLRVEAQELLAQYQRKQRDADEEAKTIIADAKKQAQIFKKNAETELSEVMERREAQLTSRIQRIEENAIADIRNQAAELAVAVTTEAIVQTLDAKEGAKLADASIESLSKQIN